jgi:hypothetical protein
VTQGQDEVPCGVGHRHGPSIEIQRVPNIGRSSYFLRRAVA